MSDSIVIEESNGEIIVIEPTVVINQTTCAAEWGGITGNIADQTDLIAAFAKKLDKDPVVLTESESNPNIITTTGVYLLWGSVILIVKKSGDTISQIYLENSIFSVRTCDVNNIENTDWMQFIDIATLDIAISAKQDKIDGKSLSTNDYTDTEKTKLANIEDGAQVNAANTVIDANYVHTDNNYTNDDKAKLSSAVTSSTVTSIITLTQTAYDATNPKIPTVLYVITGV